MSLAWSLFALLATLVLFQESGRGLRQLMFKATERLHAKLKTSRIGFWILVCLLVMGTGQIFAAELAWLAAIDVALYIEVLAAVALVSATARLRSAREQVGAVLNDLMHRAKSSPRPALLRMRAGHRRKPKRRFGHKQPDDEPLAPYLAVA